MVKGSVIKGECGWCGKWTRGKDPAKSEAQTRLKWVIHILLECTLVYVKMIVLLFCTTGQELTDTKLLLLANKITERSNLFNLAIHGLGLEQSAVETCITNHKEDINGAAHGVLTDWIRNKPDRKVAYDKMCRALSHENVKLRLLIEEVLNKHE